MQLGEIPSTPFMKLTRKEKRKFKKNNILMKRQRKQKLEFLMTVK